tara:strand:- start:400 stop:732 length:333 start_codon:yes stop_codon:yes gene_type:complete
MSTRRNDPWGNPWKNTPPYNPIKHSFDEFFVGSDLNSLKELLNWILGDEAVGTSMKEMKMSQTLKGTVKRNDRVYEVIITDVTPDPEEVPDEVSIEWVSDFGEGHEDLTE